MNMKTLPHDSWVGIVFGGVLDPISENGTAEYVLQSIEEMHASQGTARALMTSQQLHFFLIHTRGEKSFPVRDPIRKR